MRLTKKVM